MDAKGFKGSIAGIPVQGGIVSIDAADATTIINAAAGLVRTIADVAGSGLKFGAIIGVAFGLLTVLLKGLSTKATPKIPILSMARIETDERDFLGICKSEIFECTCDGMKLKIPIGTINSIDTAYSAIFRKESMDFCGYDISLIDGSSYSSCIPITNHLVFLTICGQQKALFFRKELVKKGFWRRSMEDWHPHNPTIFETSLNVEGVTVKSLSDLRKRLKFAFDNNLEKVVKTIGKESFEKYFILS